MGGGEGGVSLCIAGNPRVLDKAWRVLRLCCAGLHNYVLLGVTNSDCLLFTVRLNIMWSSNFCGFRGQGPSMK